MKKSFWLKLCVLALVAAMVLSFAACDGGKTNVTTEETKQDTTEAPTTKPTEPETTEAPTQPVTTDAPTVAPTEPTTTEAPTEPTTTEPVTTEPIGDKETTEAPAGETTEAPAGETTEAPAGETTEAPAGETTEAPAGETTEAPAGETTEAPAGETTEAPAGETTEAPAGETTEAPAGETTEAPATETTEAPAGETTEAPAGETTEAPVVDPDECAHDYQWQYNSGRHWKECSKCYDIIESGTHTVGTNYEGDDNNHWQECTVCHGQVNKSEHVGSYQKVDANTHKQICNLCHKDFGVAEHDYNMIAKLGEEHKCICGDTIACPAADAECLFNEEGHWYTKDCELCKISDMLVEHIPNRYVDEESGKHVFECGACDIFLECEGNHVEKNENGHMIGEDCFICGLVADDDYVAHEWGEPHDRSRECTVCGYVQTCTANHYEATEQGHRIKEDCEICQVTVESEFTSHAEGYTIVTEKGETATDYKYTCKICGYAHKTITVSNSVNYFSAPGQVVGGHASNVGDLVIDEDEMYIRVTATADQSANFKLHNGVVNYVDDGNGGLKAEVSMIDRNSTIVGGPGKYAVLKVRLGGVSLGQLKIGIYDGNTEIGYYPNTAILNTDVIYESNMRPITDDMIVADGGWLIYVVDLSSLNQTYYNINDEDTTNISVGLKIQNGKGGTATDYIDVSYFAIVDDWAEAVSVLTANGGTANEDMKLALDWKDAEKDVNFKADGSCVDHVVAYREIEGTKESLFGGDDNVCYTCKVEPYCLYCGTSQGDAQDHEVKHSFVETVTKQYEGIADGLCHVATTIITCENCVWADGYQENVDHKLGLPVKATTEQATMFTYTCSDENCLDKTHTVTVPASANFYSAPSQIVNNWATSDTESTGGTCDSTTHQWYRKSLTDLRAGVDGVYTRVHVYQGASFYIANDTGTGDAHTYDQANNVLSAPDSLEGGLGSYVVLKMRANHNYSKIMLVTDTGKTYSVARSNPAKSFETYVIDISGIKDANAQTIGVLFFSQTGTTPAGAYFDIAYFAIVDDWAEVEAVVGSGDAKVTYVTDWTNASTDTQRYANNKCIDHVTAIREEDVVMGDGTNPDVCYTCTQITYCKYCNDFEEIRTENVSVGHKTTSVLGEKNYAHTAGAGVCYTQTTTVSCDNCDFETVTETTTGHTVSKPATAENEGDVVHTYTCSGGCQKTWTNTVKAGVNYYSAPGQALNQYNSVVSMGTDGDVVYTRWTAKVSAQIRLHNVNGATGKMDSVDDVITGGPGKYAVLKVRLGGVSLGQLKIGLYDGDAELGFIGSSTVADTDKIFDGTANIRAIDQAMVDAGWIIYVVDLSSLNQTYYDIADTATDKISVGLKIRNNSGGTDTDFVDIAYFAIVDDWTEVAAVVGSETQNVEFAPVWKDATKDATRTANGACVDHTLVTEDTGKVFGGEDENVCYSTTVTVKCSNCDYAEEPKTTTTPHNVQMPTTANTDGVVTHTYACDGGCQKTWTTTVGSNINFYSAPGQIVNNWATSDTESTGGTCGGTTHQWYRKSLTDLRYSAKDGVYTRVHLYQGASYYITNGTKPIDDYAENTTIDALNGGLGSYIVMRVRTNHKCLTITLATDTGKTLTANRDGVPAEFATYVIDISSLKDETAQSIRVMFRASTSSLDALAGNYVDIAYVAIVDDWAEVAAVVGNGEEKITFVSAWGTPENDKTRYANGNCIDHIVATREEDVVVGDGTNADVCYTYTEVQYCSACGQMEEIRTENLTKGHKVSTVNGDNNYDHAEGLDVCHTNTTTVSCDKCDYETVTTTKTGHKLSAPATTVDGGNTVHTYTCSGGCQKTWTNTVGADINYYSAPGMIVNNYNTTISDVKTEGDFTYTRITFKEYGQARIHNVIGKNTIVKDVDDEIVGGPGRYIVMKVRVGNTTMANFGLALWDGNNMVPTDAPYSEANPNVDVIYSGTNSRAIAQSMVDASWTIYVIDIASLNQTWYDITDEETNLISVGIKAVTGAAQNENSWIDVAYFAIVDDWTEVAAVVGSETQNVEFAPAWKDATKDLTRKANGTCVDHALYTEDSGKVFSEGINADNCYTATSTVKCSYCDYAEEPKVTTAGHKLGAAVVTTDADGNTIYTYTCTEAGCGESFTVVNPKGTNYFSAPGYQINNWASSASPLPGGTSGSTGHNGSYMVTPFVDSENGVYNRVYLNQGGHFFLANGSVAGSAHAGEAIADLVYGGIGQYAVFKIRANDNLSIGLRITNDKGANIGLAFRAPANGFVTYVVDISGVKNAEAEKIRVFISGHTGTTPAGSSVDVAYFAIVDSWAEAEDVIGEGEKVVFTTTFDNPANDESRFSDGSCVNHKCTTTVDNGTYTFACSVCDFESTRTVEVGADGVNFYSAPGQLASAWNGSATVLADADGTVYSHVTCKASGQIAVGNGTGTAGLSSHSSTIYGSGKYIVLKVRMSSGIGQLKIGAYDGTSSSDKIGNTDPIFDTYSARSTLNSDWKVFVVDLEEFAKIHSYYYYEANNSELTTAGFGLKVMNGGSGTFDLAYFAVCDNWTEIESVVGDEDVVLTNWANAATDEVKTAAQIDELVAAEQAQ